MSIAKLSMVEYFYIVLHFPPLQRTIFVFFKFQIPEKKQVLQNTYKHSCALNLSSSSICVSISSFSENKREGGEEGEIQRTE